MREGGGGSYGEKQQKNRESAFASLALLIYHRLSRNYCLPEQEFLARHDVPRRVPWNGGEGGGRGRGAPFLCNLKVLMTSKLGDSQYSLRSVTFSRIAVDFPLFFFSFFFSSSLLPPFSLSFSFFGSLPLFPFFSSIPRAHRAQPLRFENLLSRRVLNSVQRQNLSRRQPSVQFYKRQVLTQFPPMSVRRAGRGRLHKLRKRNLSSLRTCNIANERRNLSSGLRASFFDHRWGCLRWGIPFSSSSFFPSRFLLRSHKICIR